MDKQEDSPVENNVDLESNVEQEQEKSQTSEFEEKMNNLKEQLLRALADNENLRRRMEKQVEETAKFAISGFTKDLINVSENLYRALQSYESEKVQDQLLRNILEGVVMTQKELLSVFEKHKIEVIKPNLGDVFDHNLHQAVGQVENAELNPGTIGQVLQNGYALHERVLRPAMVMVVKSDN